MHDPALHPFGVCSLQELYLVATWNVKAYQKFTKPKISTLAANFPLKSTMGTIYLRCEAGWDDRRHDGDIHCAYPSIYMTDTRHIATYGDLSTERTGQRKPQYQQFDLDAGVGLFYSSACYYGYGDDTIVHFLEMLMGAGGAMNMNVVDLPRIKRWKIEPTNYAYDGHHKTIQRPEQSQNG